MTTIAYKDGVLAADSLSTSGPTVCGYVTKVVKRGPYLAAASGSGILCLAFLDWFRSGMKGAPPEMKNGDHEAVGHIFTPEGLHIERFHYGWHRERNSVYADGSGGDVAKGAMSMGAGAEQAVRIAMEHDAATGGEIIVLTH